MEGNTTAPVEAEDIVLVYSMPQCQACRMTQRALEKENVPFEVVDLQDNPQLIEEFREQGLTSAPIVEYHGERSAGFRPDRLRNIAASLTRPDPAAIAQSSAQPHTATGSTMTRSYSPSAQASAGKTR